MLQYFKHNLKKKNYFYSLILYFYFLTFKILFFFQIDIIQFNNYLKFFQVKGNNTVVKFMKINTSNILSIFNNTNNSCKFIFTIFKRDLFFVSTKNLIILNNLNNQILLDYLVMVSIDYYFLNIQYLSKIDLLHKLFLNNYNLLKIFILKLFYINLSYSYFIKKLNKYY